MYRAKAMQPVSVKNSCPTELNLNRFCHLTIPLREVTEWATLNFCIVTNITKFENYIWVYIHSAWSAPVLADSGNRNSDASFTNP